MATTIPDTLKHPNIGDPYAPVQDMGALADTTQAAFIRRANLYVGSSAQRVAFTTAALGAHWQDTNGTRREYVKRAAGWEALVVTGSQTLSLTAGSPTGTATVTFPTGSFLSAPMVMVTKQSSGAAKYVPYVQSVTSTGFVVGAYSGDGTSTAHTIIFGWAAFLV